MELKKKEVKHNKILTKNMNVTIATTANRHFKIETLRKRVKNFTMILFFELKI